MICTSYRPADLLYTLNQMLLHPATLTHVSKSVALRITELACSTLERIRFTPPDMQVLKYPTFGTKTRICFTGRARKMRCMRP